MELTAPSSWHCVDFISDLHLQASESLTFNAWSTYLLDTEADAVFILGDLFEVWVGDDVLALEDGFGKQCADVMRAAAKRVSLYVMRGNRDFLMGDTLMAACHSNLLEDPTVLPFGGQRWLLSHGDAWCLDDTAYMQFREQVRNADWRRAFLDKPLTERIALAHAMRMQSESRKHGETSFADVDSRVATMALKTAHANYLIHGHTHRAARHSLDDGRERLVLGDWDLTAKPARAEVLRLRRSVHGNAEAFTLERIPPAMTSAKART